eukprot:TRINITY_DN1774_c0_g1_i1.p1 TRINITY_DN1774_c0_g1~~TRINITY_DN1774_c0_g1_i1.p1  ORF type:complete len:303 (-),score=65.84 TRINITY_DN1774_c0_g1_i1:818-1654(-)
MALRVADLQQLQDAMFTLSCVVCINTIFLALWRVVPRLGALGRIERLGARLVAVSGVTLLIWLAMAMALLTVETVFLVYGLPLVALAVLASVTVLVMGLLLTIVRPIAAPKGTRPVSKWMYLARGTLAALCVGGGVFLARLSPVVGALTALFPAIYLTTVVALWWSQGEDVQRGAVGPMILGSWGLTVYAFPFVGFYRTFVPLMPQVAALAVTVVLTEIVCLGGCSVPVFLVSRWTAKRRAEIAVAAAKRRAVELHGVGGEEELDDDTEGLLESPRQL